MNHSNKTSNQNSRPLQFFDNRVRMSLKEKRKATFLYFFPNIKKSNMESACTMFFPAGDLVKDDSTFHRCFTV